MFLKTSKSVHCLTKLQKFHINIIQSGSEKCMKNVKESILTDSNDNRRIKVLNQQINFLKKINSVHLIPMMPQHILNKKLHISSLYLINKNIANKFASAIIQNLDKNERKYKLIEINPGFGFLTEELLNYEFPKMYLFEGNAKFLDPLKNLKEKHPNRLIIMKKQFLDLWRFNNDKEFQGQIKQIYCDQTKNWEEKSTLNIVATIPNINFVTHWIHVVVFEKFLFQFGRPKMYLAMLPSVWHKLTAEHSVRELYRWRSVLFQLLFNYKQIEVLDRQSFFPWGHGKKNKKKVYKDLKMLDENRMYIVEIEPKQNIFKDVFEKDELPLFYYFVRSNTFARSLRVIPELEKWAPGCGVNLIHLGLNIFTEFGNLTPQEMLKIYRTFLSSPTLDKEAYFIYLKQNKTEEIQEDAEDEECDMLDEEEI